MKQLIMILVLAVLVGTVVGPEAADFTGLDITLGRVNVPRPFIHAGKDYAGGVYWITLSEKEGVPYFNVHDKDKKLLFDELAVLKPKNTSGSADKMKHRVHKGLISGSEYFKIKVDRGDSDIIAFLLVKKPAADLNKPAAKTTGPVLE